RFPRLLFSLLGLVDPTMREVAKMGYLWDHPMELRDDRLAAILGPDFGTPYKAAVAATITPHFARAGARAAGARSRCRFTHRGRSPAAYHSRRRAAASRDPTRRDSRP